MILHSNTLSGEWAAQEQYRRSPWTIRHAILSGYLEADRTYQLLVAAHELAFNVLHYGTTVRAHC